MFVLGLIIGASFIGAPIGLFVASLCVAASRGDAHLEALERGGIHGPSDPPSSPGPSQVPVMKAIPGGLTAKEYAEALRKVGRPE